VDGGAATIWITDQAMNAPVSIASDKAFIGSPRWNPEGDKAAFLAAGAADSVGELRVFDFDKKAMIQATTQSRVRTFSWSADGKRLFYTAGVNLADINAYHVDSLTLSKVTSDAHTPRSEANPAPRMLGDRDGILFESSTEGSRRILWMDAKSKAERVLVDSTGYNSLR
jgi:Tol biopolymer transport system component